MACVSNSIGNYMGNYARNWHRQTLLGEDFKSIAKTEIDKWGYIELRSFCSAKKTLNKVKRQLTESEKMIANHISDGGLISRIYEKFRKLNNNNKITQLINEQRTSTGVFPRIKYKWSTDTRTNVQDRQPSEACKYKPQWGFTSLQTEWLLSKS